MKTSIWNTYFAPTGILTRTDGSQEFRPDINELDTDVLEYWKNRATSTKNPVMAARYADLAWDFAKPIFNEKPDYKNAQQAIDRYLEAVSNHFYTMDIEAVRWLTRAFSLSVKLKDEQRSKTVIAAIFAFYDEVVKPQKVGIWVFPFDCLYQKENFLSQQQAARIITDLEKMLTITSDGGGAEEFNPFGAEVAANRLAQHYKRHNDKDNVNRVIKCYGTAFETMAQSANSMFAQAWLQPIIECYEQEGLKQDAERLQTLLAEKGKLIAGELKQVRASVSINRDAVDKTISRLVGNDNLESALQRIAIYFIPSVADTRDLLKKMQASAPLRSMIPIVKIDGDGRPTAKVGSIDNDPEGRLYLQIGQTISFYTPFLTEAVDHLRTAYVPKAEQIISWLYQSPLFLENRRDMLLEGLLAYEQGDFVKTVHILVPQVEQTLRNLLVLLGIPHIKTVRDNTGISDVKSMNQVLKDERVRQSMSENLWVYLTVLFIERRGVNIRNDLAHGLIGLSAFDKFMADRVFHSILALSLMRYPNTTERKPSPATL